MAESYAHANIHSGAKLANVGYESTIDHKIGFFNELVALEPLWKPCCLLLLGITQDDYNLVAAGEKPDDWDPPEGDIANALYALEWLTLHSGDVTDLMAAAGCEWRIRHLQTPPESLEALVDALDDADLKILEFALEYYECSCGSAEDLLLRGGTRYKFDKLMDQRPGNCFVS
jgi:hypothetical protein